MKKYLVFILASLVVVALVWYFLLPRKEINSTGEVVVQTPQPVLQEVNIQASFDIYTNGTKRIFTFSAYHNLSTDVFIESSSPNTVRVKKSGITWGGFFETLPMELTKDCLVTGTKQTFCTGDSGTLRFYINNIEDKNALDRSIKEGDRLLVEYSK